MTIDDYFRKKNDDILHYCENKNSIVYFEWKLHVLIKVALICNLDCRRVQPRYGMNNKKYHNFHEIGQIIIIDLLNSA